jgi:hypothetical protein
VAALPNRSDMPALPFNGDTIIVAESPLSPVYAAW